MYAPGAEVGMRGSAACVVGLALPALACFGGTRGAAVSGLAPLDVPVRVHDRDGTGMFHNEGCVTEDARFVAPGTLAVRVIPREGETARITTWSVPELAPGADLVAVPEYLHGSPWLIDASGDVWGLWQGALRRYEAGAQVQEAAWPDVYPDTLLQLSATRFLAHRIGFGVEVLDVESGPAWRSEEKVTAVARSPDGERLAAILDQGMARPVVIWSASDGTELSRFAPIAGTPGAIAFSPDGTRLALGSWREGLQILDASDGKVLRAADGAGPTRYVSASDDVAWAADGSRVYSISWGGAIAVHDGSGERLGWLPAPSPDPDRGPTEIPAAVGANYYDLELSPDGRHLVAWHRHPYATAFETFVCDVHLWTLP